MGISTERIDTLLAVWAHPDDEAYLAAGLMAEVARAGGRVVVATATRGEGGTDDPVRWPPHLLGPVRERELEESLAAVGVSEHRWLDHVDGTLHQVPAADGTDRVEELVRELRPDVVVTFGPDGMTGHQDHRTVSAWVTGAWRRTGARNHLWYATRTPQWHAQWRGVNEQVGLWFAGSTPPSTPADELVAEVRCTGELLDVKQRALRAHASQTAGLERLLGADRFRDWFAVESFVAAQG
jgi:LmbE family N-acetylglucosaminyl deacetylase